MKVRFRKGMILLLLLITLVITGCSNSGEYVPNVTNISMTDGKNVLSSMGYIPIIEYEYSDDIVADNIIRSEPSAGMPVSKGDRVTIYVSKGSSLIESKDSYANWNYITYGVEDNWEFYSPYIKDNTLYIECYNVIFGTAMSWRDRYGEGSASGTASVNDTFDKVIPVRLKYEKASVSANESQSFTIMVPLNDINVAKPTNLYFRIGISANNQDQDLYFDFSMTW